MRIFFFQLQLLNIILGFSLICFSSNIESAPINSKRPEHHTNEALLKRLDAFALISPASFNEEAILDQLETIQNLDSEHLLILEKLLELDPEAQQIILNQLAALPYTNIFQIAELNTRKFLRRLYDPLRKINIIDPEDRCGSVSKYRIGTWLDIGYDRAHINTSDCFEDYSLKGYDITLGVQTSITPSWTLGFAGSYEHDRINYQLGANGTNQTFLAGIYSLLRPDAYYLLGDLIVGYGHYRIRRLIDIDTDDFSADSFSRKGKPQLYQGMAYFEAGRDLPFYGCINTYLFQPFLGLEIGYFRYHNIRERAVDPLFDINIAGRSHVTFSGRLGFHFSTELFSCISVYADAAWQHRCTSLDNHIRERFVTFGDSFSITGLHLARDSLDGTVNLSLALEDNLRFYIEAAGQFWNNASTFNTFAGIQLGW